jgi:hypothetical protein
MSDYYKIDKTLISMGIGEALFTSLNEKGIPTPLVHTYMKPPLSRIGVLTPAELDGLITNSEIKAKYSEVVDRESAYELLNKKIENATVEAGKWRLQVHLQKKKKKVADFLMPLAMQLIAL